jgi:hypothetical protein
MVADIHESVLKTDVAMKDTINMYKVLSMVIALCGLSVSATLWHLVVMYSCY